MSDQLRAFTAEVIEDRGLQEEVHLLLASASPENIEDVAGRIADLAVRRGIDLAAADVVRAVRFAEPTGGGELSDDELEAVAGGTPDGDYAGTANVVGTVVQVGTTIVDTAATVATGGTTPPPSQIMSRMKNK